MEAVKHVPRREAQRTTSKTKAPEFEPRLCVWYQNFVVRCNRVKSLSECKSAREGAVGKRL